MAKYFPNFDGKYILTKILWQNTFQTFIKKYILTKILWQDTFQTSTSQKVYSVWGRVVAQRAPRLRSTLLKYCKSGPFFSFSSVTLFYHAFLSRSGTFWKIFGLDISAKCLAADPDNLPKCFPDTPLVFNEYFLNCLTWTKALDAENKNNYEI